VDAEDEYADPQSECSLLSTDIQLILDKKKSIIDEQDLGLYEIHCCLLIAS
jgi:hypothetical protein